MNKIIRYLNSGRFFLQIMPCENSSTIAIIWSMFYLFTQLAASDIRSKVDIKTLNRLPHAAHSNVSEKWYQSTCTRLLCAATGFASPIRLYCCYSYAFYSIYITCNIIYLFVNNFIHMINEIIILCIFEFASIEIVGKEVNKSIWLPAYLI